MGESSSRVYLRRAACLDPGHFITDPKTGLMQETTAQGFYSYNGAWSGDALTGYRWNLPRPCELVRFTAEGFCLAMHALHSKSPRGSGSVPKFTMVGDSVAIQHRHAVVLELKTKGKPEPPWQATSSGSRGQQAYCDSSVNFEFFRADMLEEDAGVSVNGTNTRVPLKWVQAVCASNLAVVNFGAHAKSVPIFNQTLSAAAARLTEECGDDIRSGSVKVFFRTTPEGTPFCNYPERDAYLDDMASWRNHVWPILTGQRTSAEAKTHETWHLFQHYNYIASSILQPLGVGILDVVPMTRLRRTDDWLRHKGISLDCLHGNMAVPEWNSLLLSAVYADMCQKFDAEQNLRPSERVILNEYVSAYHEASSASSALEALVRTSPHLSTLCNMSFHGKQIWHCEPSRAWVDVRTLEIVGSQTSHVISNAVFGTRGSFNESHNVVERGHALPLDRQLEFYGRHWNLDRPILFCKFCFSDKGDLGRTRSILKGFSSRPPRSFVEKGITVLRYAEIIHWRPLCLHRLSSHSMARDFAVGGSRGHPGSASFQRDIARRYLLNEIQILEQTVQRIQANKDFGVPFLVIGMHELVWSSEALSQRIVLFLSSLTSLKSTGNYDGGLKSQEGFGAQHRPSQCCGFDLDSQACSLEGPEYGVLGLENILQARVASTFLLNAARETVPINQFPKVEPKAGHHAGGRF